MSYRVSLVFLAGSALIACAEPGSAESDATRGPGDVVDVRPADSRIVDAAADAPILADIVFGDTGDPPLDVLAPDSGQRDAGSDASHACPPCPSGFTCNASGYCANADGVPAFAHVYVIVMENHSLATIQSATDAPYIHHLMSTYSYATQYLTRATSVIHPSCPNYIAMTAGDTFGIDCDCSPASASLSATASCLTARTSASCPQAATHMGDRLDAIGVSWRDYAEGMGHSCNTSDSGNYVARHVPFLYYNNVRTDSVRCAERVRDFGDFATDLSARTYRFSLIAPNLCNDMHGNGVLGLFDTCGGTSAINNGDNWLSTHVAPILTAPGFAANGTDVLFIVWDEEDNSTGSEPIPLIIVSPLVRPHSTTSVQYDHYSLLETILDGFGASRVGTPEALGASAITDVWR